MIGTADRDSSVSSLSSLVFVFSMLTVSVCVYVCLCSISPFCLCSSLVFVCVCGGGPRDSTCHSCCRRFITNYASQTKRRRRRNEAKRSFFIVVILAYYLLSLLSLLLPRAVSLWLFSLTTKQIYRVVAMLLAVVLCSSERLEAKQNKS